MSELQNELPELPFGVSSGWAGPDDDLDDTRLWLRWKPTEIFYGRVLSAAPLFYPGHWVTAVRAYRLCTYPGCKYCAGYTRGGAGGRNSASERRMRHLCAIQGHSGEQHVWEFGEAVARQIQALTGFKREGDAITRTCELRGLALQICRDAGRPLGNVLVSAAPADIVWPEFLPDPLDVAGALASSWKRAALHDGKVQPRLPVGF